MKKIISLLIAMLFILCGCGKTNYEKELNKFTEKVEKLNSYYLKGNMEIISDEDTYLYNVEVNYKKDNKYNATLINELNNHKQIILKNDDGVYVVTPSLNKSYKFQSEWPSNSSQAYILASIINDIKKDNAKKVEEIDNNIVVTVKANYPNNPKLKTEKIYFDKNMNLKFVTIYDEDENKKIEMIFTKIDYKKMPEDKTFELSSYVLEDCCKENETSGLIDNIIYPLYVPQETYLKDKETMDTDDFERVILTFSGLKNFVVVEETINISDEFEIIPVYGEPLQMEETFGIISANSLSWTRNNIEYYLSSNDLTTEEMVTIADSLNSGTLSVGK